MEHLLAFLLWFSDALLFKHGWPEFAMTWLVIAYLLWDRYVLVMGLYRAKLNGRLEGLNKALAAPNLVVGYVLDFVVNITWATLIFRELPRETLVTTRLQRLINDPHESRWRRERAKWWCEHVLDPLDPKGHHC